MSPFQISNTYISYMYSACISAVADLGGRATSCLDDASSLSTIVGGWTRAMPSDKYHSHDHNSSNSVSSAFLIVVIIIAIFTCFCLQVRKKRTET